MPDIIRRFRQAWLWTRAIRAYERNCYADAVQALQTAKELASLRLEDHVLLANALAGDGKFEAAASEYGACMQFSAQKADEDSLFIFAYSAFMRGTVTGDAVATEHFGRQLSDLRRPDALRPFIKPDWLP